MMNPKTDEQLFASVIASTKTDAESFSSGHEPADNDPFCPTRGFEEVKVIQTELYTRVSLLERNYQELLMRLASRETRVDERMNGLLRRMDATTASVEACVKQVTSFRSFGNLITLGTGIFSAIAINVVRYFFHG